MGRVARRQHREQRAHSLVDIRAVELVDQQPCCLGLLLLRPNICGAIEYCFNRLPVAGRQSACLGGAEASDQMKWCPVAGCRGLGEVYAESLRKSTSQGGFACSRWALQHQVAD